MGRESLGVGDLLQAGDAVKAQHFWEGKDSRGRDVRAYAVAVGGDVANGVSFRVRVPTWYGRLAPNSDTRSYEKAWAEERGGKPPLEWVWAPAVLHKIRDVLLAASLPSALALGNGSTIGARAVTEVAVAWDQWLARAA